MKHVRTITIQPKQAQRPGDAILDALVVFLIQFELVKTEKTLRA
jgi:hypothetical protein